MQANQCSNGVSQRWKVYAYASHWLYHEQTSQQLIVLNDTGHFVFQQMEAGLSPDAVTRNLREKYQLTETAARNDVRNYLHQWEAFDFVSETEASSGTSQQQAYVHPPAYKYIVREQSSQYRSLGVKIAGRKFRIVLQEKWLEYALLEILGHLVCAGIPREAIQLSVSRHNNHYQIYCNGEVTYKAVNKEDVINRLIYELVEACYQRPEKLAVLHAAAVANVDAALIFAGGQGSGKSTLVASLQHHGFSYLADDVCPIINNRLLPVPISQVLKAGSWEPLLSVRPELNQKCIYQRLGQSVKYLPPLNIDIKNWTKSWPIGALIFPRYRVGESSLCKPLDPIQAVQALIQSGALIMEGISQTLAWLEHTPAYSLQYSTSEDAISLVKNINTRLEKSGKSQFKASLQHHV